MRILSIVVAVLTLSAFAFLRSASADDPPKPPVQMTAQEDHKRMLELLNIKSIRRGADGNNPKSERAANLDESKANPYPDLPDPLVFKNGKKVTTADDWKQRRPGSAEIFARVGYS